MWHRFWHWINDQHRQRREVRVFYRKCVIYVRVVRTHCLWKIITVKSVRNIQVIHIDLIRRSENYRWIILDLKLADVSKKVAEVWKSLPDDKKQVRWERIVVMSIVVFFRVIRRNLQIKSCSMKKRKNVYHHMIYKQSMPMKERKELKIGWKKCVFHRSIVARRTRENCLEYSTITNEKTTFCICTFSNNTRSWWSGYWSTRLIFIRSSTISLLCRVSSKVLLNDGHKWVYKINRF